MINLDLILPCELQEFVHEYLLALHVSLVHVARVSQPCTLSLPSRPNIFSFKIPPHRRNDIPHNLTLFSILQTRNGTCLSSCHQWPTFLYQPRTSLTTSAYGRPPFGPRPSVYRIHGHVGLCEPGQRPGECEFGLYNGGAFAYPADDHNHAGRCYINFCMLIRNTSL